MGSMKVMWVPGRKKLMLRSLQAALILTVLMGTRAPAHDLQTLAALDAGFSFASPELSAETFTCAGYVWIRTERSLAQAQAAGAVLWSYETAARGDRFFIVGDAARPFIDRFELEQIGHINGMRILRLPASWDVSIPQILAFHEIRHLGDAVKAPARDRAPIEPDIQDIVDAVEPDSLYAMVDALSSIQTRFCMSDYYEVAAAYAESRLQEIGWPVESQYFTFWDTFRTRNLIATKDGTVSPDTMVILCGHLDSATYASFDDPDARAPGANDNATSSAAILEAARILSNYSFRYTIKLILFGAEEIGLYGSTAFADSAAMEGMNILCVLNGDMIAYEPDVEMEILTICNEQSSWVGDLMVATGATYTPELDVVKIVNPGFTSSDHSSFWNVGYTSIWLFEGSDYSPYIHSVDDVISTLNFPFYAEATKLFIATLAEMASDPVTIAVPDPGIAPRIALRHYPEPASGPVLLQIDARTPERTQVRVYEIGGRLVADLGGRRLSHGQNRILWDGRTDNGHLVPSGVYLITVSGLDGTHMDRLTVLR